MESSPTCSIESWESAFFSRRYGLNRDFLEVLCWNWCSSNLETCVSGNLVIRLKEVKPLVVSMGNRELLWSQCREIGLNLEFIWATPRHFIFLQLHQCSSRLLRDFSGTLCSSIKQTKAPYMFDWEQGIALHAMQGNRASSLSEQQVSWIFSSCGGNLWYVLELWRG